MRGLYIKSITTGLVLAVLIFVLLVSVQTDINAAFGTLVLIAVVLTLFARSVFGP